jgi:hypothetical protein
MKPIENFDNEEAAFALYRITSDGSDLDIDDDSIETELADQLSAALGNRDIVNRLLAGIKKSDDRAGDLARAALATIRDQELFPNSRVKLDEFTRKPPSAEDMDFGLSIAGIVMLALLSTTRLSVKHKRTSATSQGSSETEVSGSIGSDAVVKFVTSLMAKVGVPSAG